MREATAAITTNVGVVCNDCGERLPIVARTGGREHLLIVEHPICPHTLRRDGPRGSYEDWLADARQEAAGG